MQQLLSSDGNRLVFHPRQSDVRRIRRFVWIDDGPRPVNVLRPRVGSVRRSRHRPIGRFRRRRAVLIGRRRRRPRTVRRRVIGLVGVRRLRVVDRRHVARLGINRLAEDALVNRLGTDKLFVGVNRLGLRLRVRDHIRHVRIVVLDSQIYRCRRRRTVFIGDRIGEACRAVVVGVRRERHVAGCRIEAHRTVRRITNTRDREAVANINIAVVFKKFRRGECFRRVLNHRTGIIRCYGTIVRASHRDRARRRRRSTLAVAHLIAERHIPRRPNFQVLEVFTRIEAVRAVRSNRNRPFLRAAH